MKRHTLYVDGGSRGNPGPAGYGAVIQFPEEGIERERLSAALPRSTNNEAEYQGLIAGLRRLRELGAVRVLVRADSELIVRQMQGRYQVRSSQLRPLYALARELTGGFADFQIEHIPRELNREADRLANQAMDRAAGKAPAADRTPPAQAAGILEDGVVRFFATPPWPDGTRVRVRKA